MNIPPCPSWCATENHDQLLGDTWRQCESAREPITDHPGNFLQYTVSATAVRLFDMETGRELGPEVRITIGHATTTLAVSAARRFAAQLLNAADLAD